MPAMDGVILIDKPAGFTSHDVVARVRRILGTRRVGHTGTLDPFATGLLVVLVGRATRLAQFLSDAEKEYEATIRFGFATETGDVTGKPLDEGDTRDRRKLALNADDVEAAMASLRGEIEQTPPMYSAKKVKGRKLYELARRGEEIERAAVRVNVLQFESLPPNHEPLQHNDDGTIDLAVRVTCSAGTYVRTLAESAGAFLGVGAHLVRLQRTRAGKFHLADAITLADLEEKFSRETPATLLISPSAALSHLPWLTLDAEDERRTRHGMGVPPASESQPWPAQQPVRMQDVNGDLVAVGFYDEARGMIQPSVVLGPS